MKYVTTVGDKQFTIDINRDGQITVDGQAIDAEFQQMLDSSMYSMLIGGASHDVRMNEGDGVYEVQLSGEIFEVVVEDERTRRLAGLKSGSGGISGEAVIKAPMPGVVIDVPVTVEQEIEKGEIVVILESMKMQNEFKAPRAGIIKTIKISPGDRIEQNTVMIVIA